MFKFRPKAFTFDTGGTILDWHTGFKKGWEKVKIDYGLNINPSELANLQRRKSLNIITTQKGNSLVNFDQAHQIAVTEICNEKQIDIKDEDKLYLYRKIPSQLNAWDDFLEPFNSLKTSNLCVSFTLLSNRLVFTNSKKNNINWDLIISCETIGIYKPNLDAYLKTAELLQLNPSECCMVACHSFDLNAAQKAGFSTIFVKRPLEWGNDTKVNVDGEYNFVIDSFDEIASYLK